MIAVEQKMEALAGELLQFMPVVAEKLDRLDVIVRDQEQWELTVQHMLTDQKTTQDAAVDKLRALTGEHKSLYNQAGSSIRDISDWRKEVISNPPTGRETREEKRRPTHPKDLAPGSFSGKEEVEDWSKWKEDLEDYSEAVHPGARQLLVKDKG